MKVIWLCNIMPVQVAKALKKPFRSINGWISVLYEKLKENPEIELTILFPMDKKEKELQEVVEGTVCRSFFQDVKRPEFYDIEAEKLFEDVIEKTNPDIIHIWGSEYPHTLAMIRACESKQFLSRAVVSIQGLVSVYARHYTAALPESVIWGMSFRDFIKRDGVIGARKKFVLRGELETEALKKAEHVIGRTDWDYACVKQIHPELIYYKANEILRESFYTGKWKLEECQRHSVFMSQWGYPVKGFHIMLEALRDVIREYPDAQLVTTGRNPLQASVKEKIRQTKYEKYIVSLIKKWGLEKNVVFLGGEIKEEEMKEQYLKAHVFVLASSIENSPNSMGEAMLLGIPVIAADVGGVKSLLTHNKEGILYPFDEPYMLAYNIKKIFKDDDLAKLLSGAARERAARTHHIENNLKEYYKIYEAICQRNQ